LGKHLAGILLVSVNYWLTTFMEDHQPHFLGWWGPGETSKETWGLKWVEVVYKGKHESMTVGSWDLYFQS
jgi:hypothetical protein